MPRAAEVAAGAAEALASAHAAGVVFHRDVAWLDKQLNALNNSLSFQK
jgi:hypothetical protein